MFWVPLGGDGGGGHQEEKADGDEDQEQLEEDHLGPGYESGVKLMLL